MCKLDCEDDPAEGAACKQVNAEHHQVRSVSVHTISGIGSLVHGLNSRLPIVPILMAASSRTRPDRQLALHRYLRDAPFSRSIGVIGVDLLRVFCSERRSILERAAVATRMPSITAPSGYLLEPFREDADVTLYRGPRHGNHRRSWRWRVPQNSRCLRVSDVSSTNTHSQPNSIPRGQPSLWLTRHEG